MPSDCRLPGVNIVLISYKTNIITRQRVFIFYKWASSRQNLSGISFKARLKQVSSATAETS